MKLKYPLRMGAGCQEGKLSKWETLTTTLRAGFAAEVGVAGGKKKKKRL
jgi:hypothetical protein